MPAAEQALVGRREIALLDLPSVRHMANILAERCREQSWVRTSVASLDRFQNTLEHRDLEALLEHARADVAVAERALAVFERSLPGQTDAQIAALALGPQIWFRLNGVATVWRPHAGTGTPAPVTAVSKQPIDRLVLLALIGSGLHLAELLRLRLRDVGSLAGDGQLIADPAAEPLAVCYLARRGHAREYITFLSFQAREALHAHLVQRAAAGQTLDLDAPLITRRDGQPATAGSVAYARRRNSALIRIGNTVNVAMCRATGDFFRDWGMPGARFVDAAAQEELEVS